MCNRCGCSQVVPCNCITIQNGPKIGMTLIVSNSWNVPAVGGSVELDVPGTQAILVGSYIQNPLYGKYLITSFNSDTAKLVVQNPGYGNPAPGTLIGSNVYFNIANASFNKKGVWTPAFSTVAGLVFTPTTINVKDYWALEDMAFFTLNVEGTLSGTAGPDIAFSAPILPYGYGNSFNLWAVEGGVYLDGSGDITNPVALGLAAGDPLIRLKKENHANWANSGTLTFNVDGFYKVAPYNL